VSRVAVWKLMTQDGAIWDKVNGFICIWLFCHSEQSEAIFIEAKEEIATSTKVLSQ